MAELVAAISHIWDFGNACVMSVFLWCFYTENYWRGVINMLVSIMIFLLGLSMGMSFGYICYGTYVWIRG